MKRQIDLNMLDPDKSIPLEQVIKRISSRKDLPASEQLDISRKIAAERMADATQKDLPASEQLDISRKITAERMADATQKIIKNSTNPVFTLDFDRTLMKQQELIKTETKDVGVQVNFIDKKMKALEIENAKYKLLISGLKNILESHAAGLDESNVDMLGEEASNPEDFVA